MRIEHLKIGEKEYPLCCGLLALSEIQKKYGSLDKFETEFLVKKKSDKSEELEDVEELDIYEEPDVMDVYEVIETLVRHGAKAEKKKMPSEEDLETLVMQNMWLCAFTVYRVVLMSMIPTNTDEEEEKNAESQAKK